MLHPRPAHTAAHPRGCRFRLPAALPPTFKGQCCRFSYGLEVRARYTLPATGTMVTHGSAYSPTKLSPTQSRCELGYEHGHAYIYTQVARFTRRLHMRRWWCGHRRRCLPPHPNPVSNAASPQPHMRPSSRSPPHSRCRNGLPISPHPALLQPAKALAATACLIGQQGLLQGRRLCKPLTTWCIGHPAAQPSRLPAACAATLACRAGAGQQGCPPVGGPIQATPRKALRAQRQEAAVAAVAVGFRSHSLTILSSRRSKSDAR
jgi:hypothetical protein